MPDKNKADISVEESKTEDNQAEGLLDPNDHDNPVEHPTNGDNDSELELEVDAAVDDIVEKEGDQLLAAEDAEVAKAFEVNNNETWKEKLKRLYQQWWDNKRLRYATFAGLGVIALATGLVPPSRYFVLNTVGVRSRASLTVMDDSTDRPLKNVQVTLGKQSAKTDDKGQVAFKGVRLGRQELNVERRAFAPTKKSVTIGWGSNPLGQVQVKPVGAQYTFYVTDWLSGKPVASASATSGEYDAAADKEGKIVLTIDASDAEDLDVTIKADDYRDEVIKLDLSNKARIDTKLVASRKTVFVSKRSGKYDVYKVDVDGKNEDLVLAGTGRENENITLLSHPTDEVAVLVSTRDNVRNRDGYLLSTLTVIDLKDNSLASVAQSEDIRLMGWSGDKLVFMQVAAGASAPNPKRQRIIAYDYKEQAKKELASANLFNDFMLIGDTIYYIPSSAYGMAPTNQVYSMRADGANKATILDKNAWAILRTSYDTLSLSSDQSWFTYKLGDKKATASSSAPDSTQSRLYVDSPSGKASLWTEERDGKNALLLRDTQSGDDKVLKSQAGLQLPIRWLNSSTVVYRIQTQNESADYVMSIKGGEAKKIKDVTRTISIWR